MINMKTPEQVGEDVKHLFEKVLVAPETVLETFSIKNGIDPRRSPDENVRTILDNLKPEMAEVGPLKLKIPVPSRVKRDLLR